MKKPNLKKNTSTKKKATKKPTTKKRAIKKISAKKKTAPKTKTKKTVLRAKKKTTKKLKEAPIDACFWVHNGPILKSLPELKKALREMSNEQFSHHTHGERNDFARWIEEVLEHAKCAKRVEKAKTKAETIKVLAVFIR